uniref:(northern house mosquito) hypothetical protein n=1 Tax=Culex pipiens TaxID=7175 RepID=A0A8D8G3N0_CULPI
MNCSVSVGLTRKHVTQRRSTRCIARFAFTGQKRRLSDASRPFSPTCRFSVCRVSMISSVRWCFSGRIIGCRWLYGKSELLRRPPTLSSPLSFSTIGFNLFSLLLSGLPASRRFRSSLNSSCWTAFTIA